MNRNTPLPPQDYTSYTRPKTQGKLIATICAFTILSLVVSLIGPASPYGFILALVTLGLCLVQFLFDKYHKGQGKPADVLSFGKFKIGAEKFAIAALVAAVISPINFAAYSSNSHNAPSDNVPAATTSQKSAEELAKERREKKEQEKKEREEREARKKEEEARKQAVENATHQQGTALSILATLPIKGRAPKTGYARDKFGSPWKDMDRNGCDTRNDILHRDLTNPNIDANSNNCKVLSGELNDPYTGTKIAFTRGKDSSSDVQIDHVVALSDAWQKGAQQLDDTAREVFANDAYNLLAVSGKANMQKSDGDASTWLPSNKNYRCEYVARQIGVKAKYSLWVTQAEHDAMVKVLGSCPTQTVPQDNGLNVSEIQKRVEEEKKPKEEPQPAPAPQPAPQPQQQPAPQPQPQQDSGNVYYPNCAAVRAQGKAPLYQGQPGYSPKLDRDHDGVACE